MIRLSGRTTNLPRREYPWALRGLITGFELRSTCPRHGKTRKEYSSSLTPGMSIAFISSSVSRVTIHWLCDSLTCHFISLSSKTISCEGMIWTTEGLPLQGLTGGYGGDRRVEFILDHKARSFTYRVRDTALFVPPIPFL